MKTYTIENETNNISLHSSVKEAEAVPEAERFSSEAAFGKLAAEWPASRLVEIWNSLPGVTPVKKFKDPGTAVSRIWKELQNLGNSSPDAMPTEAEAEPPATPGETVPAAEPESIVATHVEPLPDPATRAPGRDVGSARRDHAGAHRRYRARWRTGARRCAGGGHCDHEATPAKKARKEEHPRNAREGSKTAQVIEMLKREGGTTIEEVMTAMGWQNTPRERCSARAGRLRGTTGS